MNLQNVMSKDVITLERDDSIERAAELMKKHNIGSIPVCHNEEVIGIITDRDIALRSVAEKQNNNLKVSDIMSSNPVCGSKDMDIHEASRLMSERQIRRLPVTENDKIIGIVALGDIAIEPKHEDEAGCALSGISQQNS